MQPTDLKENNEKSSQRSHRVRTGLLLLGSAVLGGLAVAFWNRRTLVKMQGEAVEKSKKLPMNDKDAIY